MPDAPFEKCVFINCPFDEDYDIILKAILFCLTYLGLTPRIDYSTPELLAAMSEWFAKGRPV